MALFWRHGHRLSSSHCPELLRRMERRHSNLCFSPKVADDEATIHPCQFPVELIERLVLALTDEGDWVMDPFMGVGTTAIAALMHKRRAIGADIVPEYIEIAKERVQLAEEGKLRIRPMDRPVYDPNAPQVSVPPKIVNLQADISTPRLMERIVRERKK